MKSKPSFRVELIKGGKVVEFGCTIVDDGGISNQEDPEAYSKLISTII